MEDDPSPRAPRRARAQTWKPRFLKSLLCQVLPSVSVGRAGRRVLSHSDKPISPDRAKARRRAQPRPCGARPRGAAPVGDPERTATLRPRGLLLKCRATAGLRGVPWPLRSAASTCRGGWGGGAKRPPAPAARACAILSRAALASQQLPVPLEAQVLYCLPPQLLRWVLWGPPGLLAAQRNKTRRPGFAPARTTVWPPEQGTQALGPQFCRIYYLSPLGLGRSGTYHFGPRQLVGQTSLCGLVTT